MLLELQHIHHEALHACCHSDWVDYEADTDGTEFMDEGNCTICATVKKAVAQPEGPEGTFVP